MYEYFAGCDTHKEQHTIAIINHFGKLIESFEIENTNAGWTLALKKIQNYSSIIFGIENSALMYLGINKYKKLVKSYFTINSNWVSARFIIIISIIISRTLHIFVIFYT